MCTVTYFPLKNKIVLTSNRDEKPNRSAQEIHREKGIFYPKDATKNGTWFAVSENGNALILLNGAFENHPVKTNYRKSRGLIVLDLIAEEDIFESIELIDLENIEPFTLVIFQEKQLAEFRWDGTEKHFKRLDAHLPYIWSSATLYDAKAQEKRREIFKEFLQTKPISEKDILDFHHQKTDDPENGGKKSRLHFDNLFFPELKNHSHYFFDNLLVRLNFQPEQRPNLSIRYWVLQ
jgi:uncharacterized protein with NRDE domain